MGEIREMETKRYMGEDGLETWVIKTSNYKSMNHIRVPTSFDVLRRLEQGAYSYAKFKITEIEYYVSKKF